MTTNFPSQVTPKRSRALQISPCSPPIGDQAIYPWNWHEGARTIELSPGGPCSPDDDGSTSWKSADAIRRGRPRLDTITSLILEGSSSPSAIKCNVCNRVFPREKSLQAHMRTHTGEKPYICDYPDCTRAFAQSGQLKTHQRLHTGEKPFICTEPGCRQRFTHANRHCPDHPYALLQRCSGTILEVAKADGENKSEAVMRWLEKFEKSKQEKSSSKLRERKLKRELDEQAKKDVVQLERKKKKPNCAEGTERMLGALALMELANVPQVEKELKDDNICGFPPTDELVMNATQVESCAVEDILPTFESQFSFNLSEDYGLDFGGDSPLDLSKPSSYS